MLKTVLLAISLSIFGCFAQQKKILIIGGGTTGISAANEIINNHPEIDLTLIEKERVVGGNAFTYSMDHNGKQIHIDLGPQYFSDGAWDNYIELLDSYHLHDKTSYAEFPASFTIAKNQQERPFFMTPKNGKRREKIKTLLTFNKFYSSARKIYKKGEKIEEMTVGQWIDGLKLKSSFKNQTIYSFLSASLGVDHATIRTISANQIVKLFAFQSAMKKNTFKVMNIGMGGVIQQIGDSLEAKGVHIIRNTAVERVVQNETNYTILTSDGARRVFDFVVFATHPDAIIKMIEDENVENEFQSDLEKMKYFKAQIVLHKDPQFIHSTYPSFLNIMADTNGVVTSSTMNLGIIHSDNEGLYKSWLNDDDLAAVKSRGTYITERVFYHPVITPAFMEAVNSLKAKESKVNNLFFAGAWSLGMETQDTAVRSGKLAAEKVKMFLSK